MCNKFHLKKYAPHVFIEGSSEKNCITKDNKVATTQAITVSWINESY